MEHSPEGALVRKPPVVFSVPASLDLWLLATSSDWLVLLGSMRMCLPKSRTCSVEFILPTGCREIGDLHPSTSLALLGHHGTRPHGEAELVSKCSIATASVNYRLAEALTVPGQPQWANTYSHSTPGFGFGFGFDFWAGTVIYFWVNFLHWVPGSCSGNYSLTLMSHRNLSIFPSLAFILIGKKSINRQKYLPILPNH